jgi:hypothetical protein
MVVNSYAESVVRTTRTNVENSRCLYRIGVAKVRLAAQFLNLFTFQTLT